MGGGGERGVWHWVCRRAGRDWARIAGCWFLASGVIVGGVGGAFGRAGAPAGW